ncbi:hypothetical protein [Dickeya chrysanthemi]|uniref:hypothetical protein n=1 Tax=Dickeya chrysanthemi TaxID=556 RepID=UPI000907AD20|nr:hypothetical protein [Dickeya chrysanthemi]
MIKLKYIFIFPILISVSTSNASAAVCSPSAELNMKQAQYNAMKNDAAQLDPVAKNFMKNVSNSLDTIGCTDAWPTGNLGINLPSVDSIIKKTKEAVISKACSLAREKVSQLTGSMSENVSLDMPVIGNVASGSLSTGTGSSSSSSINVNGASTDVWNSISNVMK